jgi:hypothetical protein
MQSDVLGFRGHFWDEEPESRAGLRVPEQKKTKGQYEAGHRRTFETAKARLGHRACPDGPRFPIPLALF